MSRRADLLEEAKSIVTSDRNTSYGTPEQNFRRIADLANALGFRAPGGGPLLAYHVALFLALVKLARIVTSPSKRDSWTDLAGYAACGYEAATTVPSEDDGQPTAAGDAA